jgi:hypothetical protein
MNRNLPYMIANDGRKIPIRRVRLEVSKSTFQVGNGPTARNVENKGNHHLEIFEVKDKKGNAKWKGEIVSQFDAMRRLRAGEPVVRRERGGFKFSLASGETFELTDGETGEIKRFKVRTISGPTVEYVALSDARLKKDIKQKGDWFTLTGDAMRKRGLRKIVVTPLGEVRYAND